MNEHSSSDAVTDAAAAPSAPDHDTAVESVHDADDAPSHLRHLVVDGRDVWLLGTAHISAESVAEVEHAVATLAPDTVCVELCEPRYQSLTDPTHWQKLDIFAVLRQGKALFLLANLALSSWQRRLGDRFGVKPGAELLAAVRAAEAAGARVVLIDREIHRTLKRAWASVPFFKRTMLAANVVASVFDKGGEEISAEQIEAMKADAMKSDVMNELAQVMPEVKAALIDERDAYMMQRIREAEGTRILAVVGAGHVPGMTRNVDTPADTTALETIPPPGPVRRLIPWVIPAIVLGAFALGWQKNGGRSVEEMIYAWLLPNCIAAALLTALAGGRPLSVVVAFVASPITSLNPLLGAGMVTGLVEAWLRKPTVEDAEKIADDMTTWKGVYRNPFLRVLLVTVAATLGSALGAWIGATWVVSLLGR